MRAALARVLTRAADLVIADRVRTKAVQTADPGEASSVTAWGTGWGAGWWPLIRESFAGAWQTNTEVTIANVTTHPAVFACVTLIASDIAKMRPRIVQQDAAGIWSEITVDAFSPLLRKPNPFQTRIQFLESWVTSKLLHGNTYVLKVRDGRNTVRALYVLDPGRVAVLIAEDGEVFYRLGGDDLAELPQEEYTVPASEIIHDRFNCLFHALVGLSPIYACGLSAVQGLNILNSSTSFFGNGANPGGVILVPTAIEQAAAARIKEYWETEFGGDNAGKVAILTNGMKYEQMKVSAVDSQLIEQLRWTAEIICGVFHVPPHMVGFGPAPKFDNLEALHAQYYAQCLQVHIESIELLLDHGLRLTEGENAANRYGTEFDLDDLLRMDSATMTATLDKGRNYYTPNEGRLKLNLPPVAGGDTVYRQQQDYSLEALAKRDAQADPFARKPAPAPAAAAAPATAEADPDLELEAASVLVAELTRKELSVEHAA